MDEHNAAPAAAQPQSSSPLSKRARRESGNPSDWVVVNFDPARCDPPSLQVEMKRLKALHQYDIMDNSKDTAKECYQRITAMVARALDVPIALITLVDLGRMWTLAGTGVPEDLELPRQQSICTHTILSRDEQVFDVPNISEDERFCNNTFMQQAGLTFYAGAPLVSPDGCKVGAVCVVDSKTHHLTDKEKAFLKDIAATVVDLMEQNKKLRDAEKKVEMMCSIADGEATQCTNSDNEEAAPVPAAASAPAKVGEDS